jgi:hypothetical protein
MLLVILLALTAYATRGTWLRIGAQSLVCEPGHEASDAILIDLVGRGYPLFERAKVLQDKGLARTILVPVLRDQRQSEPLSLSVAVIDLMCTTAHLAQCITLDVPLAEPISLNMATRIGDDLKSRGVRSILLVTDGFRSKRSAVVYSAILRPLGIAIRCQPVFGTRSTSDWYRSRHGIQDVGLQLLKLLYYRIFVLPSLHT